MPNTYVRVELEDGTLVAEVPMPNTGKATVRLDYDVKYRARLIDRTTGTDLHEPLFPVERTSLLPSKMVFEPYALQACVQHPWIDWPGGYYQGNVKKFPPGTKVTVSLPSDPTFTPETVTLPNGTWVYLPVKHYPKGVYKLVADLAPAHPGTQLRTYEVDFAGGTALDGPVQLHMSQECGDVRIRPEYNTVPIKDSRGSLVGLPALTTRIFRQDPNTSQWLLLQTLAKGQTFTTRIEGRYRSVLGPDDCPLDIQEFDVKIDRPRIKYFHTLGYYCDEIAQTTNRVLIEAEGGKAPYKYQLFEYDATKPNSKGAATTYVAKGQPLGTQVEFANVTGLRYIIEITDACGEQFWQEVEIVALDRAITAKADNPIVCEGHELVLRTHSLPNVAYKWYHKDRPSQILSTASTLTIPHAGVGDAGTYVVVVAPDICPGKQLSLETEIQVIPRLTGVTLTATREKLCQAQEATFSITHTSGRAPYTYVWEVSRDGGAQWTDLPATTAQMSYRATAADKVGTMLTFRCTVTDDCGTALTAPTLALPVVQCFVPVNPHLMHRARQ